MKLRDRKTEKALRERILADLGTPSALKGHEGLAARAAVEKASAAAFPKGQRRLPRFAVASLLAAFAFIVLPLAVSVGLNGGTLRGSAPQSTEDAAVDRDSQNPDGGKAPSEAESETDGTEQSSDGSGSEFAGNAEGADGLRGGEVYRIIALAAGGGLVACTALFLIFKPKRRE